MWRIAPDKVMEAKRSHPLVIHFREVHGGARQTILMRTISSVSKWVFFKRPWSFKRPFWSKRSLFGHYFYLRSLFFKRVFV